MRASIRRIQCMICLHHNNVIMHAMVLLSYNVWFACTCEFFWLVKREDYSPTWILLIEALKWSVSYYRNDQCSKRWKPNKSLEEKAWIFRGLHCPKKLRVIYLLEIFGLPTSYNSIFQLHFCMRAAFGARWTLLLWRSLRCDVSRVASSIVQSTFQNALPENGQTWL